jgi:hypothetical protein
MNQLTYNCTLCNSKNEVELLFDYPVCGKCKKRMGLFQDATIKKYYLEFEQGLKDGTKDISFEGEMKRRLDYIEKDYIKKKIKLLHVLDRLGQIGR